jgi:hypothetical protein
MQELFYGLKFHVAWGTKEAGLIRKSEWVILGNITSFQTGAKIS